VARLARSFVACGVRGESARKIRKHCRENGRRSVLKKKNSPSLLGDPRIVIRLLEIQVFHDKSKEKGMGSARGIRRKRRGGNREEEIKEEEKALACRRQQWSTGWPQLLRSLRGARGENRSAHNTGVGIR
jgi:hypothetical protein